MDSTTLDDERWQRMRRLFLDISTLDMAGREAGLAGEDAHVASAVRRLLAVHDEMTGTGGLASPPIAAALAAIGEEALQQNDATIAQFRVERLLGEGGMGRVYLARREIGGSLQRVALKIVPLAMRTPRLVEQLRRERAILASLDHPHIARLIDAGELPDGRPYFAMEYVDGMPLLRHCDERRLDLRARIALFLDACEAVSHAHRQLVLHRDLKSSNILVDAEGRLRLLDFGIAKSLEDAQAREATGDAFFSLRAASPEQVLGRPTTISTDVYGLGGLLYELLAGSPPFRFDEDSRDTLIQRIAHEPPPPASVTASGNADTAVAANRRCADAAALAAALRGDLDSVLAKALRKDPEERYRSVDELAAELRKVLEFRPIAARASQRWYRLRMLLRRHRVTAAVAATLGLAVLATTAVSVLQYFRAEAERDRAVEALASAQTQRDHAQHVADFLVDAFGAADPGRDRLNEMPAGKLIQQAATKLGNRSGLDPAVHARLAQTLSWLFYRLDRADDAARQAGIAKDALAAFAGPPDELLVRQGLVEAAAAILQNRYKDAAESARTGLGHVADPLRFGDSDLLLQLLEVRARVSYHLGQNKLAVRQAESALALLDTRGDVASERMDGLRRLRVQGLTAAADFRGALAAVQILFDGQRKDDRVHDANHVETLRLLGQAYMRVGDYDKALTFYEAALAKCREIYGDDGGTRTLLLHGGVASAYARLGLVPEAIQRFRLAIELARRQYGEKSNHLSLFYFHIADCYHVLGEMTMAESFYRRALDTTPPENVGNRAIYRRHLGQQLLLGGKLFEAAHELEQAREDLLRVYPSGGQLDAARINLAELQQRRFDLAGASAYLDGAVLQAARERPADTVSRAQAERLSAYFGWSRADGSTIVPPLSR